MARLVTAPDRGHVTATFSPRHERGLAGVAAALFVLGVAAVVLRLAGPEAIPETVISVFDPDQEQSLVTWYSSVVLAMAAVLAAVRAALATGDRRAWALTAAGFALASLDEVAGIHERAGFALERSFDVSRFLWVVPAAVLVVAAAAVAIPFVLRLEPPVRRTLVVGAALFVAGALGVEAATGVVYEAGGREGATYAVTTLVEEGLEVGGALLLLHAVLLELRARGARLTLAFRPD